MQPVSLSPIRVLVICSNRENYFSYFQGRTDVEIDQAPWIDIRGITSFSDSIVVHIGPQKEAFVGTSQTRHRTFSPDLVLLRSFVLGAPGHDWRSKMAGFFHQNVETVNSLDSFAFSVEKEKMWGLLRKCRDEDPTFPLISDTYYSSATVASFVESGFPLVVKVGSASQGVGKSQVKDEGAWKDTLSLLAMMNDGFCSEPLVSWVSDLRLQKIGNHYRAIRRFKTGFQESWKANDAFGISEEDVPMEERWQSWCDLASRHLKMDILGLDLLVDADGREFVLECNSSSIGFPERHRAQDVGHIVELLEEKISLVRAKKERSLRSKTLLRQLKEQTSNLESTLGIAVWSQVRNVAMQKQDSLEQAFRAVMVATKKKVEGKDQFVFAALLAVAAVSHQGPCSERYVSESLLHAVLIPHLLKSNDQFLIANSIEMGIEMGVLKTK